jgi:rubredoxin
VHIEASAEEKARDPTLKYLLIDEAKNCRSKAFKAKRWAGSNRADDDPDAKSNFIERMESQEHHRRDDMTNRRAAADYDALLTRKECPNCGSKQKYDEVKDKKTKCPNCDIEYRPKLTWSQVGKSFLNRTSKHSTESQAKQEELVKAIEEMEEPKLQRFDPKLGKVVTVAAPKNKKRWTESTKAEFFDRMDDHLDKAKKNLQKIEDESFGVQCTFMPKTGAKRDEEDEEDTGVHAFLRRLDEEWEEKKAKSPHLFTDKYTPDPELDGKPSWKPT